MPYAFRLLYIFVRCKLTIRLICVLFSFALLGCTNSKPLQTPEKIGEKERTGIVSGKRAAVVVNKLHGRSVADNANIIAEYGRGKKDLLYITQYKGRKEAKKSFDLMVEKIAAATDGPFYHLTPLTKYENRAYMTLGMGAIHYIYLSGDALLWLQTYQSFGTALPPRLLKLYPPPGK